MVLAFDVGEREKCVEVEIFSDELVEDDEIFLVNLEQIDPSQQILLQPSTARVTIIGEDHIYDVVNVHKVYI